MQVLTDPLALRAANLYSEGSSFSQISEQLEISKSRVGSLIRQGIASMSNNDGNPVEAPVVQIEKEQENTPVEFDYEIPTLNDELSKTFIAQASPILRKVALNPKVFLFHDYAKASLGYKGDIGECISGPVWSTQRSHQKTPLILNLFNNSTFASACVLFY